ncbi:MAG: FecR domain-containing protein [Opitutae bacterium]|nr:FecR domain-containing protein [Opitutae bacterium]
MNPHEPAPADLSERERAALDAHAADWLIAHDRGLTTEETNAFRRWLAADVRHAQAWAEAQQAWGRLDRMPELASERQRVSRFSRRRLWQISGLAAAAVLVLGFFMWQRPAPATVSTRAAMVRLMPRLQTLPDGSVVELNADSAVTTQFTAAERRVQLVRGEAHFSVKKDATRPFVVEAGGVAVRAVGTAFNVRLASSAVEVLVTEGRVRLDPPVPTPATESVPAMTQPTPTAGGLSEPAVLAAGQRAVVAQARAAIPQVTDVSAEEMARALAWQALRLQFQDMPLDKVAAEFNRHCHTQLVVHPAAADVLVAGVFRADNVEVFVQFLEQGFRIKATRRGDGAIVLSRAD